MTKFKVGDEAIDVSDQDEGCTFIIKEIDNVLGMYYYNVFRNGIHLTEVRFDITRFDKECRKLTKLDKALK